MAIIDSYRNNASRKKQEIQKINVDNAKEQTKIADNSMKIIKAKQSISRTKSQSTISSKLREIERCEKTIGDCEKKIASNHKKIAQKQKELNSEENRIRKEEEKELKKRQQDDAKRIRDSQRRDYEINNQLNKHESLHVKTQMEIDDLKKLPNTINVLFLASNPLDQNHLRLDEEVRAIMENIRKSEYRDSVNINSIWATRPLDLLQALNEYKPTIVHFSAHGSQQDEIVFQDGEGKTKMVSKEAIVQTMSASIDNIRVVFFNTCYSRKQAEAIVNHIEAAIGMNSSIGDTAARIFAAQFYSAIGFGKSIKVAFEQARSALLLENISENDTPELFIQTGINADDIILVGNE